jgi:hypothetical protein
MLPENDNRHGTANGYNNHACRCDKCRAAWATYITAARHKDPKKTRAQRRLYDQRRSVRDASADLAPEPVEK